VLTAILFGVAFNALATAAGFFLSFILAA